MSRTKIASQIVTRKWGPTRHTYSYPLSYMQISRLLGLGAIIANCINAVALVPPPLSKVAPILAHKQIRLATPGPFQTNVVPINSLFSIAVPLELCRFGPASTKMDV